MDSAGGILESFDDIGVESSSTSAKGKVATSSRLVVSVVPLSSEGKTHLGVTESCIFCRYSEESNNSSAGERVTNGAFIVCS